MTEQETATDHVAPNFLYIGAPRCASTYLDSILRAHPKVYVPRNIKEVRYFDKRYDRGDAWYRSHFPTEPEARDYAAIGELTPTYLFEPEAPSRIAALGTVRRFLVGFRNPVDRLLSQYAFLKGYPGIKGYPGKGTTLDGFIDRSPLGVPLSLYSEGLARFADQFGAESLLVLIYERMFKDPAETARRVATHLGVDPDGFAADALHRRVNQAKALRFERLYRTARWAGQSLYKTGLFPTKVVSYRLNLRRFFTTQSTDAVALAPEQRTRLIEMFEPDIAAVERFIGSDLPEWRR